MMGNKIVKPSVYLCRHRHDGYAHPNCYTEYLLGAKGKVGFLDIESSNLDANWGLMLTWCIKEAGGKILSDSLRPEDFAHYGYDRRITKSVIDAMRGFDVIVSYYGSGFDIPFIRSKAMKYKLSFPIYTQVHHIDMYYIVRSKMKLHSNRLASVCDFLGISGKTPIKTEYWVRALHGDRDALGKILDHNEGDVRILEVVYEKMLPYMSNTRTSI